MGDLGVTMRTNLLNICYALLQTPGANITHLPLLLHPDDPAYRRRILSVPTLDESTREFWERYDASRYYQASHEAVLNRLAPFFRPPLSITLSTPSFSCHRELNEHSRALFCNLSRLRGLAQELVGQLIIAQLRETFQARSHPDACSVAPDLRDDRRVS